MVSNERVSRDREPLSSEFVRRALRAAVFSAALLSSPQDGRFSHGALRQHPSYAAPWVTGHYSAGNSFEPVSNIPWNNYTHIVHFCAKPNANGTVAPAYLSQSEIQQLISSRPAGKKVLVCIGDAAPGSAFARATAPETVTTFVSNVLNFVKSNGYDGVDFDWEADISITQYIGMLQLLRKAMPDKIITTDVGNWGNLETFAAQGFRYLDQINVMCYDMDLGRPFTWYNDALFQDGDKSAMTCDWRVKAFTLAGVPAAKIGIGIPFFGRRWARASLPLVTGAFQTSTVYYRDLSTDGTRWQSANKKHDRTYDADYLSIPSMNEFDSYNGIQSINDTVQWQKANGFGGFMTFTTDYEYVANGLCDAQKYPLSTALRAAITGSPVQERGLSAASCSGVVASSAKF